MQSSASRNVSFIMIVPSMASFKSVNVVRTVEMTRCIRSISCFKKMFIGAYAPIFCIRPRTWTQKSRLNNNNCYYDNHKSELHSCDRILAEIFGNSYYSGEDSKPMGTGPPSPQNLEVKFCERIIATSFRRNGETWYIIQHYNLAVYLHHAIDPVSLSQSPAWILLMTVTYVSNGDAPVMNSWRIKIRRNLHNILPWSR